MHIFSKCLEGVDGMTGQDDRRWSWQKGYARGRLLILLWAVCGFGCSASLSELIPPGTLPSEARGASSSQMTIALSQVDATAEGLQVALNGSQPFSYRLVNHAQPRQLTIEVPRARIEQPEVRTVGYSGIESIRLSQVEGSETLARLEIELADDAHYSVSKAQARLAVVVRAADASAPVKPQAVALKSSAGVRAKASSGAGMASKIPRAQEYRVGSGDMLSVTVYDEPDLTLQRRVTERGLIDFPLIGKVQVAGLTATQVEERLEGQLSPGYLRDPQVFVDVAEFASKKSISWGPCQNRPPSPCVAKRPCWKCCPRPKASVKVARSRSSGASQRRAGKVPTTMMSGRFTWISTICCAAAICQKT